MRIKIILPGLTLMCLINNVVSRIQNVVVVGGGLAGLAAARTLSNDELNRFHVHVYEAKRDRFGGRVWTKRNLSVHSKDIQADLGGMFLNSHVKDNALINLTHYYDIETDFIGPVQVFNMENNKIENSKEVEKAMEQAKDLIMEAVTKVRTNKENIPLSVAVDREISKRRLDDSSLVVRLLRSLPSYNIPDYSALLYSPEQLDFGYDTFVKFGLAEIVDRLVGGVEAEAPLDINLRQVVRQLEVSEDRGHVLVRTRDGSQVVADAVIVAAPITVLQNDSLLFDPPLPRKFYENLRKLKMKQAERVVLEFDEMFWPKDAGSFMLTGADGNEQTMLMSWTNLNRISDRPYLAGTISHGDVEKFQKMSDEDVIELSLKRLARIFGEDVIKQRNVTNILRSDWSRTIHIGGSSVYPSVGNVESLWDIFSEPVCPGLYFAGDYTVLDGIGSMHGAFISGVRAAEALKSGYCEKVAEKKREMELKEIQKNSSREQEKESNDSSDVKRSKVVDEL